MTRATRYIIFPAMTAALAVAAFGIYKDAAPKPKLTELPRFTIEHVHCAVYSDCTTLPHVHKPLAGWDEDRPMTKAQVDTFDARWNAMFNPTPVAEWNVPDYQGAPYAQIAPVPYTDGPFMTAVDPDGIIVNAQQPMTLYPKEWSAMAQGGIPHDCPRLTAKEDKAMCE